jgi:hypothetical protein
MTTKPHAEPVPVSQLISDLARSVSQATDRALALARFTEEKEIEAVAEKVVEKANEEREEA